MDKTPVVEVRVAAVLARLALLQGSDQVVIGPVTLGRHVEKQVQLGGVGDDPVAGVGEGLLLGIQGGRLVGSGCGHCP